MVVLVTTGAPALAVDVGISARKRPTLPSLSLGPLVDSRWQTGSPLGPTYGIQAAERGVQGSVWAVGADDGSLGVGGVATGQGLMVRVGGLSVRVALRRRIGASVAGDRRLAAWASGRRGWREEVSGDGLTQTAQQA